MGCFMESSTATVLRSLNKNFDEEFNGNLTWTFNGKTNKNVDWKGGI